jgi:hypothetical protein
MLVNRPSDNATKIWADGIPDFEDRWKRQGRIVRVLKFPQVTLADVNSTFSAAELREIADFLDGLDAD